MLQRREVDLFLGDVAVTWERMQAVEFSFFTLADSAAFVTHAPRKLSEALALVRPFQVAVWPLVLLTIMMSGPILYMIIAMPYRLEDWARGTMARRRRFKVQRGSAFYHMQYIQEMNYGTLPGGAEIAGTPRHPSLDRCIWYTINVYLRQCEGSIGLALKGLLIKVNCSGDHSVQRSRLPILLNSFVAMCDLRTWGRVLGSAYVSIGKTGQGRTHRFRLGKFIFELSLIRCIFP